MQPFTTISDKKTYEIWKQLKETFPSIGEFYLHGSRAKGLANENSDFDFACQHTQPWVNQRWMMEQEGFKEIIIESYVDNDTTFVYEKIINGEKVQVSFRKDLNRYKACWTSLDTETYRKLFWKQSPTCLPVEIRRDLWNIMYRCYDEGSSFVF